MSSHSTNFAKILQQVLAKEGIVEKDCPMTKKRTPTELLDGAYAIKTADENLAYYKDFANHYDAEFATKLGYVYPAMIANFYHKYATETDYPIADIGCGTGLVAEALKLSQSHIHGFDISPAMLDQSAAKGLYAALSCIDLTKNINSPKKLFGAVVSAGTFTHGHLGPEPLTKLLNLAAPNALFCIGVNAQHYATHGFEAVLKRMEIERQITKPKLKNVLIFSNPNYTHGEETAHILIFRKTKN